MNTLIAYFSYTGHTKGIAQQIQDLTEEHSLKSGLQMPIPATMILPNARPAKKPVKITARHWRSRFPILLPMTPSCWELPTGSIRLPHRSLHSFRRMISLVKDRIVLHQRRRRSGPYRLQHSKLVKGTEMLDSLNLYEDGGADAKAKIEAWLKKNGLY